MLTGVLVAAALASVSSLDEQWIAARPLSIEGLAEARVVAAAGPWVAYLRVLPLPEELRRYHAPRPAWELVRVGVDGAGSETIAASPARPGGGQYAPTRIAVGEDGTVVATWRHGDEVLIAPPGRTAERRKVYEGASLECVALGADRILLVDEASRELRAHALGTLAVEAPRELGQFLPRRQDELALAAPWLAWIEASGDLAAVDIESGKRVRVALAAPSSVQIDGVWNGYFLAHVARSPEGPLAYVVDLLQGRAHTLAIPSAPAACLPEGVLGSGWLWDPVDGSLRRLQPLEERLESVLRPAPGVLWLRERDDRRFRVLDLATAAVSIPGGTELSPLPELPEHAAEEAALAAWRASR